MDPSIAMNAYRGIRAGCWMDNSIRSRALLTGNVSTDESRNEIRKSPGAPSPPANATIFCFHPPKPGGKEFSPVAQLSLVGAQIYPERMRGNAVPHSR